MIALLCGLALAAGLDGVKPEKLRGETVYDQTDEGSAVVDGAGHLWTGSGRSLKDRGLALAGATGVRATSPAVVWKTANNGLVSDTRLILYDADEGKKIAQVQVDALVLDAVGVKGGAAVLLPGELRLVLGAGGAPDPLPMPLSAETLAFVDGAVEVLGPGWSAPLRLDGPKGCPTGPLPETGHLADLVRWRPLLLQCGRPLPPLNPALAATAQVEADVALRRAFLYGDAVTVQGLGYRGERAVSLFRPAAGEAMGRFRTRDQSTATVNKRLLGPGITVILRNPDPTLNLRAWISGHDAPACAGRIVLAPPAAATVGWWEQRVDAALAEAGAGCGPDVLVAHPDEVYTAEELRQGEITAEAWYLDAGARLMGSRSGALAPVYARLDLARTRGGDDPLRAFAELPELNPAWRVGPGPVGQFALDVDGSWVAGIGWDLVRGTPDLLRQEHLPFLGPVGPVRVWKDGRVEAWVSGEGLLVDLDARKAVPASVEPFPLWRDRPVDPGVWLLSQGEAARPDPRQKGRVCVVKGLGMLVSRVRAVGEGAILETPMGLVGVGSDCVPTWRAVDVSDYALSHNFLLLATSEGLGGYLIP